MGRCGQPVEGREKNALITECKPIENHIGEMGGGGGVDRVCGGGSN